MPVRFPLLWPFVLCYVPVVILQATPFPAIQRGASVLLDSGSFVIQNVPISIPEGAHVQLSGVELDAVQLPLLPGLDVWQPFGAQRPSAPDLLNGLFSLAPGAQLTLQDVQLRTKDTFVAALYTWGCVAGLPDWDEDKPQGAARDSVHVYSWHAGQWNASGLLVLGPDAAVSVGASGNASCAIALVDTFPELMDAAASLSAALPDAHIFLGGNITMPPCTACVKGRVTLQSRVRVSSLKGWPGPSYLSTGFFNEGVMRADDPAAAVLFQGLWFPTMSLGPYSMLPLAALPWGMWLVHDDRCRQGERILAYNCNITVERETLDFVAYWTGNLLSPFPDQRAAAAWYLNDRICNSSFQRTPIYSKAVFLDRYMWHIDDVSALGARLINSTVLDIKPPGGDEPFNRSGLQLTLLFSDPYQPWTDVDWVTSAGQLLQALASSSRKHIVLLNNITLADINATDLDPIILTRNLEISGWPARPTFIDWHLTGPIITIAAGNTLMLRNLVLLNMGGAQAKAVQPTWARNLTSYLWPITFAREQSETTPQLTLHSVTMVMPEQELAFLVQDYLSSQSVVMYGSQPRANRKPPMWHAGVCAGCTLLTSLAWGTDGGASGSNVSLLSVPANSPNASSVLPFPQLPFTGTIPDYLLSGAGLQPHTGHGSDRNKLLLAILLPVMLGGVLPIIVFLTFLAMFWHKKRLTAAVEKARSERDPESQYVCFGDQDSQRGNSRSSLASAHQHTAVQQPLLPADPRLSPAPAARSLASSSNGGGSRGYLLGAAAVAEDLFPMRDLPSHHAQSQSHSPYPASAGTFPHTTTSSSTTGASSGATAGGASGHRRSGTDPASARSNTRGSGRTTSGRPRTAAIPEDGSEWDSFDCVPEHAEQLLINRMEMSRELQASLAAAPDVAGQLKSLVMSMQAELGDQEVEVTRVIGQGGGGVVYQGTWRGLTVAVKTLVFTVLPHAPMSRRQHRAMTEAAICRTLQHPNIVATYAYDLHELRSAGAPRLQRSLSAAMYGQEQSPISSTSLRSSSTIVGSSDPPPAVERVDYPTEFKLFIIQEYCDGGTLKAAVDDGKLLDLSAAPARPSLASILQLAADIAAGMAHVHSRNIVHGDLTPANVLLRMSPAAESSFIAKVADFGLSWKLSSGQDHVSNARQGTSFYISPEVLHVGIMSKKADVWSFGMILHEMYHGTPFWRKRGADVGAQVAAAGAPSRDNVTWDPACPADYRSLACACLASDPAARPNFFTIVETLLAMISRLRAAVQQAHDVAATSLAAGAATCGVCNGVAALGGVSGHAGSPHGGAAGAGAWESCEGIAAEQEPGSCSKPEMSGPPASSHLALSRLMRTPTAGVLQERSVREVLNSVRTTFTGVGRGSSSSGGGTACVLQATPAMPVTPSGRIMQMPAVLEDLEALGDLDLEVLHDVMQVGGPGGEESKSPHPTEAQVDSQAVGGSAHGDAAGVRASGTGSASEGTAAGSPAVKQEAAVVGELAAEPPSCSQAGSGELRPPHVSPHEARQAAAHRIFPAPATPSACLSPVLPVLPTTPGAARCEIETLDPDAIDAAQLQQLHGSKGAGVGEGSLHERRSDPASSGRPEEPACMPGAGHTAVAGTPAWAVLGISSS